MKIIWYKKASDIPEKYFSSLIDREIECWWLKPFSEFMICDICKRIYSIEDIYWNIENYNKNIKSDQNKICECWWKTKLLYPKEKFIKLLQDYIKWEVSSVLLLEEDVVEWFWFLSKSTLSNLLENEFNTRPDSYDKEVILLKLSNLLWSSDIENEKIICMNHIYLPKKHRKNNNAYKISENIFLNNKEHSWIPVLLETRYDSNFYPIWQSMWFKTITNDKYWYIIQYLSDYQKILDFFSSHKSYSDRKEIPWMIRAKRNALNKLKENPSFSWNKFYK